MDHQRAGDDEPAPRRGHRRPRDGLPRAGGAAARRTLSDPAPPSSFFRAQQDALRRAAGLGPLADLACGRGRHLLPAASLGAVVGVDRSRDLLEEASERARRARRPVRLVRADLESPHGLPLAPGRFGAVLVFRFLHRPGAPALAELLAPGGLLLYETFTTAQLALGTGPRNPRFLLEPGELPGLLPGVEVLSFEEGLHDGAMTARLLARRRVQAP